MALYGFTVLIDLYTFILVVCDAVIGTDTALLQTCQFGGTSELTGYLTSDSMTSSGSSWRPGLRGSPFCNNEYLEVNWREYYYRQNTYINNSSVIKMSISKYKYWCASQF